MLHRLRSRPQALLATCACATLAATGALAEPRFADWQAPVSAEALPGSSPAINTPAVDGCVSLSRDGLSLYFNSNRSGSQDIYVAVRPDTSSGFGAPERLPATINTAGGEFCPTFAQGNRLYFSRASATDLGDIYVSKFGPDGWGEAEPLGSDVNTPGSEESADFYEDEIGRSVMIYSRRNPNGSGGSIYLSVDGAPAELIPGSVNAAGANNRPSISKDGRTIFFDSTRPGGLGAQDLYFATRASPEGEFGPAANLAALNSPLFDARPSLSWDGRELYFSSARAGSESAAPDIYVSSRERERTGPKEVDF